MDPDSDLGLWSMSALDYDLSYFWLNWSLINFCSPKAIAHRVWNFRMRFSVFFVFPSFPIKMHATDAKTQKIEPDPNFFWRTKVSEAVCKRDWHNMRSYLFFNVRKFRTKFRLSVQRPWDFGLISKTCNKPGASLREDAWRDWIADNPCVIYGTVD